MSMLISLPAPLGVLSKIDLKQRRSSRAFTDSPIEPKELGTVLHAAQGVRNDDGKRLAPSAGSSYPLRIRVAAQNIVSLPPGIYLYQPAEHALERFENNRNPFRDVAAAAFDASWLSQAPAAILISAEFERTTE